MAALPDLFCHCASAKSKLKEIFFDLFGEINLSMLKTNFDTNNYDIPIIITKENIENNYLKKYDKIKEKKIHSIPKIGIISDIIKFFI